MRFFWMNGAHDIRWGPSISYRKSTKQLLIIYNPFMSTKKQLFKEWCITDLRKHIDPTKGIVIVIKSVSSSGMSRRMKVYNHDLSRHITYDVGGALGYSVNDKGVLVSGCGMDMTFALADHITHVVYTPEERKAFTGNGSGCLPWKTI